MRLYRTPQQKIHAGLKRIRPLVLNRSDEQVAARITDALMMRSLLGVLRRADAEAFDSATGFVNYEKLKASKTFAEYRRLAAQLAHFNPATLYPREEALAFWINLYNLIAIDTVIHFNVPLTGSLNDVRAVYFRAGYNIGGVFYSLHDIEQGILRGNAGHPLIPGAQFGKDDPRLQFVVSPPEPRIHFALNCAALSCPPIGVYTPQDIEAQLNQVTRAFINSDSVQIDEAAKTAKLSQIFKWYAHDFGATYTDYAPILRWIAPYHPAFESLVVETDAYTIDFFDFDWALNGVG